MFAPPIGVDLTKVYSTPRNNAERSANWEAAAPVLTELGVKWIVDEELIVKTAEEYDDDDDVALLQASLCVLLVR
jgi:hypothetical protein